MQGNSPVQQDIINDLISQCLLSILIPTVYGREELLIKLIQKIKQKHSWVEIETDGGNHYGICYSLPISFLILKDDKSKTIGEKREDLYKKSFGIFSWQIDDDDDIADNAIQLILEAIKSNPEVDCITFEEYVNIDGVEQRSNHSLQYADWANNQDGYDYVRTPFMKSVIKTEIAKSVPIPHIRFGEDHQWAQVLKPHLKTEIHISEQLYRYIHISSPHNERYGIK